MSKTKCMIESYPPSSDALTRVLQSEREKLNSRFATQSHVSGGLDGPAFLHHVANVIGPIVDAVDQSHPQRTRDVAVALYDVSLELFANKLLGSKATCREVAHVWTHVLPQMPTLIAEDPANISRRLTNAAYNLAQSESVRFDFWQSEIALVAAHCENREQLLQAGCILAWRAGMVLYRDAALLAADELPVAVAAQALGLPANTDDATLQATLTPVRQSPWRSLESANRRQPLNRLQLVGVVGNFRGFGGLFLQPPQVFFAEDTLMVSDGDGQWRLWADCYGSIFKRVAAGEVLTAQHTPEDTQVDKRGRVSWDQAQASFPALARPRSFARDQHTLAVTLENSHRVFLLAVS